METKVRFTLKQTDRELTFSILEEDSSIFLFGLDGTNELKVPIRNDDGILRLIGGNPFEENYEIVEERLLGLSSDWLESKAQGFENDFGFEIEVVNRPGYGPDDIFVENKPFSLRQIVDLINYGDIELTPNFQRNFVWDRTRQSKLIESIFLGLPLPSIYLSQYEDGRLTVVDGLQRLTTIKHFLEDNLILTNLEYLDVCNGMKYSQIEKLLTPLRLRKFGQTQIMCFVIDYRSPSQLKFDLFRRLNTGGKPLNNQEIRNCLSKPLLQSTLYEMVHSKVFYEATAASIKDTRMESQESALRFMFFRELILSNTSLSVYSGNMDDTLDNYIDFLNSKNADAFHEIKVQYEIALKNSYHLFGDYCFRKVLPDTIGGRRAPINKLLMLSISVLLAGYEHEFILQFPKEFLLVPMANLTHANYDFFRSITYSTNSKWNILTAFEILDNDLFKIHLNEN